MSENSFKTIRDGAIATVVGGSILLIIPSLRVYFSDFVLWIWAWIVECWAVLNTSYPFPGWLLLIVFTLAIFGLLNIYLGVKKRNKFSENSLLTDPANLMLTLESASSGNVKIFEESKLLSNTDKYISSASKGRVTFDYSNNNGRYFIGQDNFIFEIKFSKSSGQCIQIYNDPISIRTLAIVRNRHSMCAIDDASTYDTSSRVRSPKINQIALLQNVNGFYAAIKIISIKDDTRGSEFDEVVFDYIIQTNGSADFTNS